MEYRDSVWREIKIGDYLTYPVRYGSSMFVKVGRVVSLGNQAQRWGGGDAVPSINVRGAETRTYRLNNSFTPQSKESTITRLERTTVIPTDSVTAQMRNACLGLAPKSVVLA